MDTIATDAVRVVFDPDGGLLNRVEFLAGGRVLRPLSRAPWLDTGERFDGVDRHLQALAGDFFCAPFGASDVEPAPAHGWSANARWSRTGGNDASAHYTLDRKILGATLTKGIALRAGDPVVYQRHRFTGGSGALPIAHHAMLYVPGGAVLSFSAKAAALTPPAPPESDPARGRSVLAYPQHAADLSALTLRSGGTVDAGRYPFADGHEDFVLLPDAEPQSNPIGWSAALAVADGFLFFALKDARMLPSTALWMSNGGRDYPPWLGRHRAVLGIEEANTFFGEGHRASAAPNALSDAGHPTAVALDPARPTVVRYAFGAIPADPAWSRVADIRPEGDRLVIRDAGGAETMVPFDGAFFAGEDG